MVWKIFKCNFKVMCKNLYRKLVHLNIIIFFSLKHSLTHSRNRLLLQNKFQCKNKKKMFLLFHHYKFHRKRKILLLQLYQIKIFFSKNPSKYNHSNNSSSFSCLKKKFHHNNKSMGQNKKDR